MRSRYGLARYLAGATAARAGDEASAPALVLLGLAATGSSRSAGLVLGALTAATAVGGPVLGAVLDRARRPPRLLAGCLLGYALGLALLTVVLARAALWPAVLVAVAAGAFGPALSAGWSSRLATVVPSAAIRRGYAADSASFAVSALAGPALAGVLAAALHPTHAVLAAALLLVAAVPFALGLPSGPPAPSDRAAAPRPTTVPPAGPTPAPAWPNTATVGANPNTATAPTRPDVGASPARPDPASASARADAGAGYAGAESRAASAGVESKAAAEAVGPAAAFAAGAASVPARSGAAPVRAEPGAASVPAQEGVVATAASPDAGSVTAEPVRGAAPGASLGTMLRRGARAVLADRALRTATLVSALSYLGIGAATVALPVLGAALTGRAGTGALLLSVTAGGALLSTAALARWPVRIGAPAQVVAATATMGTGLAVLACAPSWPFALVGAAVVGVGDGPQLSALLEIRHRAAGPELRTQVFAAGVSIKQAGYAVGAASAGLIATSSARPALVLAVLAQLAALAVAALPANRRASIS